MVYEILPKGEQNAISPKALTALLGMTGARQLRRTIEEERNKGALILSTFDAPGGYFRPADGEQGQREISRCYRVHRTKALSSLRWLSVMRKRIEDCGGSIE